MRPIFTNKWSCLDMYLIFVWEEFIRLLNRNLHGQILHTKIKSLTEWPPFFLKTEGFTKRPLLFIILTKWPPIFLLSSLKDPFFLYLVCHRKTPTLGSYPQIPVTSICDYPGGPCPWTPPLTLKRAPGPHAVRRFAHSASKVTAQSQTR